jgi:anti-sigma B factor antagonist
MAGLLQLRHLVEREHEILFVEGELDIASAPALLEGANAVLGRPNVSCLLDLEGVSFIDVSGLQAVLIIKKRVEARGGAFALSGASDQALRLLEISGVEELSAIDRKAHAA